MSVKTIRLEGVIEQKEIVSDVSRSTRLYHIDSYLTFTNQIPITWEVPDGTADSLIDPATIGTATGLIIRVNRPAGSSSSIKFRLESISAPLLPLEQALILLGTQLTKVYITNDSGGPVDLIIHFIE